LNKRHKKQKQMRITAIRTHARRRMKQRFGIELNRELEIRMVKMIQARKAVFLGSTSNTRSNFIIEIDNKILQVVYDKKQKMIVTAMDKTWNRENNWRKY